MILNPPINVGSILFSNSIFLFIYSPDTLNKETIEKISLIIGEKINKKIELENKIDPTLIGGFKIILKNDIYDTSISSQIENIKKVILED